MHWLTFVAGAVLSWGVYGAMLHQGQQKLGGPLRALLCVGIAYFLIGVIVPVIVMMSQGQLDSRGWNTSGTTFAMVAGALGAIGAVCIIYSFRAGGSPTYVMPLVFGGAPLVNVLYTMAVHPPKHGVNPLLYVGFLVTAVGAGMVLYFKPAA
jgi:drug/metabolite transporter (DMT)-like permease